MAENARIWWMLWIILSFALGGELALFDDITHGHGWWIALYVATIAASLHTCLTLFWCEQKYVISSFLVLILLGALVFDWLASLIK